MAVPTSPSSLLHLSVAPARVVRGDGAISGSLDFVRQLGDRPLVVGSETHWSATQLQPLWQDDRLQIQRAGYGPDCCDSAVARLEASATEHRANVIIGIGGGKCLDLAKLVAHRLQLPVVTIPTSAATCAAWTALSNIYSEAGAFLYDVSLAQCPDLLILDYDLVATAPVRTLVAGIGDSIAKWYEASASSGGSDRTLLIAAVQQARVLRDLLFQKSAAALADIGGPEWRDVVDANVLLAGAIGGLGGAQCRTVAAHATHNGLTHLPACHDMLHGEKVAFGILVQLRLEETIGGNQLAIIARQQLLDFYGSLAEPLQGRLGLPCTLADLGLGHATVADLQRAAAIACEPRSDIHRLPFGVEPEQLVGAMVSTAPFRGSLVDS
jgi:glycerol dehydrogenase-like iron-containing ADH family enzyme